MRRSYLPFAGCDEDQAMSLDGCRLMDLPKIQDTRGNLTFIESSRHIPFEIKRVFYIYDIPGGESRAAHALKTCHQFIIAMSGSFDVVLEDGLLKKTYQLNGPYYGLYIPPMTWREINNFSSGSVCLSLASEMYDEKSYYRDYQEFLRAVRKK